MLNESNNMFYVDDDGIYFSCCVKERSADKSEIIRNCTQWYTLEEIKKVADEIKYD